jgi:peptidoglycan/LPS O-acetylase OafA/YrhL
MEQLRPMKYKPEIDGLRTLAVVPVILFHAGLGLMKGGYAGVDVFFVISGYLITRLMLDEHERSKFSILKFYERRARRILPALLVVMLACLPAAYVLMSPAELSALASSMLAVSFFVSNILFWKQSGYFATDAELKPLLHTWSLSVEEQFYLLFPLLLWLVFRLGKRKVLAFFLVLLASSLAIATWTSTARPSAGFFLLPSRFWELLIGSTLAALHFYGTKRPSHSAANALSACGLLATLASFFIFDAQTPFPSLFTLLPTLGAAMIIHAATPETVVGKLLGSRVMVHLGLLSYSAYLWHQPLFAFARLACFGAVPAYVLVVLSILTFGLAQLTLKIVESPFRDRKRMSVKKIWLFALGSALTTVVVNVAVAKTAGFESRFSPDARNLLSSFEGHAAYVESRHKSPALQLETDFREGWDRHLLIVGDSFSEDLVNAVVEAGGFPGYETRMVYLHAACGIYWGAEPANTIEGGVPPVERKRCSAARAETEARLRRNLPKADVVLFASNWKPWAASRIDATLVNLKIPASAQVFVLGKKTFGVIAPMKYVPMHENVRVSYHNPIDVEAIALNRTLSDLASRAHFTFVDTHRMFCGSADASSCNIFTSDGKLISYDGLHLTQAGARRMGELLFSEEPLMQYAAK